MGFMSRFLLKITLFVIRGNLENLRVGNLSLSIPHKVCLLYTDHINGVIVTSHFWMHNAVPSVSSHLPRRCANYPIPATNRRRDQATN